eukprot:153668-Chlamydomonas_euryale.AAC.1
MHEAVQVGMDGSHRPPGRPRRMCAHRRWANRGIREEGRFGREAARGAGEHGHIASLCPHADVIAKAIATSKKTSAGMAQWKGPLAIRAISDKADRHEVEGSNPRKNGFPRWSSEVISLPKDGHFSVGALGGCPWHHWGTKG